MINCLVAVERSHGIGYQGYMPWPTLPGDMSWFKSLTVNQIVIMGSVTWQSLGRPLPNRINVVLSKNSIVSADHCFSDIDTAILFCQNEYPDKEIFIIGGDSIYRQCMEKIDVFYITEIESTYLCDRYFDFDYVIQNCKNVRTISEFSSPIPYTINEYKI